MSTRALRRIQEQREKKQVEQEQQSTNETDSGDENITEPQKTQQSMFALLGETADNDEDEDLDSELQAGHSEETEPINREIEAPNSIPKSTNKRRKKKKKGKTALHTTSTEKPNEAARDVEALLQSASINNADSSPTRNPAANSQEFQRITQLLAVNTHHLQVANEMKRLFGRAAIEGEEEERKAQRSREQQRQGDRISISEAVTGRHSRGGPGLPAVIRKRNIFTQGKEEWPKAANAGLEMIVKEHRKDGVIQFNFTHNKIYQSTQNEFEACVQMMDPQLLVNLVRYNPYHVSTLLQVSEIAKQDKDPATAGELLERALFTFGRSLHPSFKTMLAQGKARLDFARAEDREFWLAARRYVGNISMKATWRTALEWCKVVLAVDPENDPYCMLLMIDQLALRSREFEYLMGLWNAGLFKAEPAINAYFSHSLAIRGTEGDSDRARQALTEAIQRYPWAAARLLQELDVKKIPPAIWGSEPAYDVEKLHSELYVAQAKDIWKVPEALSFLTSVCAEVRQGSVHAVHSYRNISVDEARYVFLLDQPQLLGLLPRSLTEKITSMSDPLPPNDDSNRQAPRGGRWAQVLERLVGTNVMNDPNLARIRQEYNEDPEEFLRELRELEAEENEAEQSQSDEELDPD